MSEPASEWTETVLASDYSDEQLEAASSMVAAIGPTFSGGIHCGAAGDRFWPA